MPLPAVADSLDAIPEPARAFYRESEGRFVLDADGVEDVSGLKKALRDERERAKSEAAKAREFASLGLTPEEIAQLRGEREKRAEDEARRSGDIEAWKAAQAKALDTERAEKTALKSKLESVLLEREATAAIADAKGVPVLLMPHVKAATRIDGDAVRVVDAAGNARYKTNGDAMTVADLVSELRADPIFGRAFESSGASGSGAPSQGAGRTGMVRSRADLTSASAKAAYIEQHGLDAYKALAA